jgi:hypothetical protein
MVPKATVTLSRLVLVVGVVVIVMSLVYPSGLSGGAWVEPGKWEGQYFLATDDFYLHAFTDHGNYTFSLYVLDHEGILSFLESGTVAGVEPLLAAENVQEYEGAVHFSGRGTYGIVVTHHYNESLRIVYYALVLPNLSLLTSGLLIAAPMAAIQLGILLWNRGDTRREPSSHESAL